MPQSSILEIQKQRQLLELEYENEKQQFQNQTEVRGIERSVRQGLCWYPIKTGRSYYNSLNQFVIKQKRTASKNLKYQFELGKPVSILKEKQTNSLFLWKNTLFLQYRNSYFGNGCFVNCKKGPRI